MTQQELNLRLTIQEIQYIFKALGFQPFHEVYELIGKINEQVNLQLQDSDAETPADDQPDSQSK